MKRLLPRLRPPLRESSPSPNQNFSRRRFLVSAGAACVGISVVPARVLQGAGNSPNGKLCLAGIGIGGVGFGQLEECEKAGFQIVALCDVDDHYARKAYDRWPQARRYRDFRELLQAEGDKIDAVYCGTPDHTHALITIAALRRKKHVCCVKPLTRTVHELRAVVQAARAARVATQVTAAPNTSDDACRVCEIVQAGVLGEVREMHLWSNRPVWPQGMTRPPGSDPIPDHFDWKLWLGPAPERPFKANWAKHDPALTQMNLGEWDPGIAGVYHPFNFRGWWDFGTGALGDMGCHHFNTPFRALQLGAIERVQASGSKVFLETAPLSSLVSYDFPARPGFPELRVCWYDGGLKPPAPPAFVNSPWPAEGNLYVGTRGSLFHTWNGIQVRPAAAAKAAESVPRTLPRRSGTWGEWHEACRGGEPAGCNFDLAEGITAAVLFGNIALRVGKVLEWNDRQQAFTNEPAANKFLSDHYHNGWSLVDI